MTDRLLEDAQRLIRKGSRSFSLASRLFDRETRANAVLLYAWCRHCDDVVDGQFLGEGAHDWGGDALTRLEALEQKTAFALHGVEQGDLPFDALARVVQATAMPARYPKDLLHGFRMDVLGKEPQTMQDLLRYCYHVAGAVGVMMAIVMGVAPDDHATLLRASDLGISFQLNNIARDVAEDAARRRCYLPRDLMADAGLSPGNYTDPANARALHQLVSQLVNLAEEYEQSASFGVSGLRNRQAWAVLSAAGIYGDIGRKIRALGPVALQQRMHTRKRDKLLSVVLALPKVLVREHPRTKGESRAGLFTPQFSG